LNLGFPSVGKSTLLSNLAGVYSEVAAYEFTTLTTVPGVIRYKGAKIQLLDLPGIIEGAKDGKGRGKQVIAGTLHELHLFHINIIPLLLAEPLWSSN
uniref:OBG-type G domain-containing protein n=1 Tax=Haemonchus placei TaxID=6290 RepID=A0A0N4W127_HAEPC